MDMRLTTENLIKKGVSRYSLITGISKRAREIAERNEELGIQTDEKPVMVAAREFAEDGFDIVPATNTEEE